MSYWKPYEWVVFALGMVANLHLVAAFLVRWWLYPGELEGAGFLIGASFLLIGMPSACIGFLIGVAVSLIRAEFTTSLAAPTVFFVAIALMRGPG